MRGYAIEVRAYANKTHRPPRDFTRSRVWHAICASCFQDRRGNRGKLPSHTVYTDDGQMGALRPVYEKCCFCNHVRTAWRIRLAGQHVACNHTMRRS